MATAKQLAARALFKKRVQSGYFKKHARKKNPLPSSSKSSSFFPSIKPRKIRELAKKGHVVKVFIDDRVSIDGKFYRIDRTIGRKRNPAPTPRKTNPGSVRAHNFHYAVEIKNGEAWRVQAFFSGQAAANEYAKALARKHPHASIRVVKK